ncbi:hypothetical protein [Collinsella tanakaei]|uniref:hypothetical protein n=1 Tax=Collinsella tanakaei TaxID=626935 RepID=UPI0022E12B81|nr:hypothetical protein [Collinsella tanakaei]
MTVYIAARYAEKSRNSKIALELRKLGFDVVLPREFKVRADAREKSKYVYRECLNALVRSSTLLVVSPFGRDVAFEIGFYQCLRQSELAGPYRPMHIVRLNTDEHESIEDDMISNAVDYESNDIREVCNYISRYEKTEDFGSTKRKRSLKKKFNSDAKMRVARA